MNKLIDEFKLLSLYDSKLKNIIKIQKWYKECKKKICTKIKAIIELMIMNNDIMVKCLFEIISISKKFPLQKNENKFIYGKLIEKAILNAFLKIGFKCIDLDKKHKTGSEYKNDINFQKINFSIKAKLRKSGNIILINKKSSNIHNIDMHLIVCLIETKELFFIPHYIVDKKKYVTNEIGSISYKSSLLTSIKNEYYEYIYKFPLLTKKQIYELSLLKEIDIMNKLYNDEIKSK